MSRRSDKDDADAWLLRFWLKFTLLIEDPSAAPAPDSGVAELTSSAWRVLIELATRPDQDNPVDVDTLSKACGLSHATTYRALADLDSVKYIRNRRSDDDGRLVERELTEAGRNALGKIKHAARSLS